MITDARKQINKLLNELYDLNREYFKLETHYCNKYPNGLPLVATKRLNKMLGVIDHVDAKITALETAERGLIKATA